jgi:hypothetical protein
MSGNAKEWLIVLAFFIGFVVFTFVEAIWVSKRPTVALPKALLFAFTSNLLSLIIGFFVSFVIVGVILAMAWDGSLAKVPGNDASIITALVIAAVFPWGVLVLAKRVLIRLMKLSGIPSPFIYSLIASALFFLFTIGPSVTLGYLLF